MYVCAGKLADCTQAQSDLITLVCQVPDFLRFVPHGSLPALLATNSELRGQVRGFVTSISIDRAEDAPQLLSSQWPRLTSLCVRSPLHSYSTQHLWQQSWPQLTRLNLDMVCLDLPCLTLLAQNNWPLLEHLSLRGTNLYDTRMAVLKQGTWPSMKSLDLRKCNMDGRSIHYLTTGPWPQLESLCLDRNYLTPPEVAQLSEAHWPLLRKLSLSLALCSLVGTDCAVRHSFCDATYHSFPAQSLCSFNIVQWPMLEHLNLQKIRYHSAVLSFGSLVQRCWPVLKTLVLDGHRLWDRHCAALCKASWPLLESLELSGTAVSSRGMSQLVLANWPVLKRLNLSGNEFNTDTYAHLATGQWPQLESLCLRGCSMTESGMAELIKGRWCCLKILDISCWTLSAEAIIQFLATDWTELESLALPCGDIMGCIFELLSPNNIAGLNVGTNVVTDPRLIADGRWHRLQMLRFRGPC